MKKGISLFLVGIFTLLLASCGAASSSQKAPSGQNEAKTKSSVAASPQEKEVKIGVLIPGSPTDGGFSQQGAESAKKLEDKGYSVTLVQAGNAETIRSEAETMASEGYEIVFGHGGQCASPFKEISGDFPETWFITLGGNVVTPNQFPVCVNAEEGFYVMGVVGAMLSGTGKLAAQLGGDYPAYRKATVAYQLGAESVKPNTETMVTVLSSPDANEAYETTLNQIKAGADIVISNTNEGQTGAMKAINETDGVYTFGCLGNFSAQAVGKVVGNVSADFSVGYLQATEAVLSGQIKEPEIMFLTMANGSVTFAWDEEVKKTLPQDVVDAGEKAILGIKDGSIDVPNEYELDEYLS